MISYASDGFYFPLVVIDVTKGGALGGRPEAPEAKVQSPGVLVTKQLRPILMASVLHKPRIVRGSFLPPPVAPCPPSGHIERQEFVISQLVLAGSDVFLTDQLNFVPATGTPVQLFLNGIEQTFGYGGDYVIVGQQIEWLAGSGTAVPLEVDDVILVEYEAVATSIVEQTENITAEDVPTGVDYFLVDELDFQPADPSAVRLFLNGQLQIPSQDYEVLGKKIKWLAGSGTAVFLEADDEIVIEYERQA